jgi:hypothetical protein
MTIEESRNKKYYKKNMEILRQKARERYHSIPIEERRQMEANRRNRERALRQKDIYQMYHLDKSKLIKDSIALQGVHYG